MFYALKLWLIRQRFILINATLFYLFSELVLQLIVQIIVQPYLGQSIALVDFCRMDCGWYLSIVKEGYDLQPFRHTAQDAANWAFFPAFPLIANGLVRSLGLNPAIALLIASKGFLWLSIIAFMQLAKQEYDDKSVLPAGLMVALNPYLIYAHSGYTETFYFFLTTLAFLALNQQKWLKASLIGALLSMTRVVGVVFGLAYLLERLNKSTLANNGLSIIRDLLIIPLGLSVYMFYLYWLSGDVLAFSHVQIAWNRWLMNPLEYYIRGLTSFNWNLYYALYVSAAFIVSMWWFWRGNFSYAIFIICSTLIPLSTWLMGMPRYVIWQMPFILGILDLSLRFKFFRWSYWIFSILTILVMCFAWFTRNDIVI